ncbi:PIN domain-containing protein [Microbacterium sp. 3H14]|uniref:PIN domain-containing protein n=1 Tax=unclassified Microbacterium TaxID=2609290 RepID=UPI001068E39A|nr:PIN domain-containing protein [Microbacterium sp. 3H14]TFB17241.1 PIN domain-containing protein [Microbacterium sp. 3H14]
MYTAVLDTCALVPSLQRDLLLQLAAERAYAPRWGTGILFELDYVLERIDRKRGVEQAPSDRYRVRLFEQMHKAFPGATVNAPKDGSYTYALNDLHDGHVAHTAIIGKADAIVTNDGRAGFRTSHVLLEANIETVHPIEFATNTVAAHPEAGVSALQEIASRRSTTPTDILDDLRDGYRMTGVDEILRPLL